MADDRLLVSQYCPRRFFQPDGPKSILRSGPVNQINCPHCHIKPLIAYCQRSARNKRRIFTFPTSWGEMCTCMKAGGVIKYASSQPVRIRKGYILSITLKTGRHNSATLRAPCTVKYIEVPQAGSKARASLQTCSNISSNAPHLCNNFRDEYKDEHKPYFSDFLPGIMAIVRQFAARLIASLQVHHICGGRHVA